IASASRELRGVRRSERRSISLARNSTVRNASSFATSASRVRRSSEKRRSWTFRVRWSCTNVRAMFVETIASIHRRSTPETPRNAHQGSKCTRSAKRSAGIDSTVRRSAARLGACSRSPSNRIAPSRTRGGPPIRSTTVKGTRHSGSTNGKVYFVMISASSRASRRPTMLRWRLPGSRVVRLALVERVEPSGRRLARFRMGDLGGLFKEMLDRVARLRLIQEERDLSFIEAQLGRQLDSEFLIAGKQGLQDRQDIGPHERLRGMQVAGELARDRVAGAALRPGSRHLNQVVRELELSAARPAFPGHRYAARHELARVRPQPVALSSTDPTQEDVGSAQDIVTPGEVVRSAELVRQVLIDPQDEILRRLVEVSDRLAGPPRIARPQDFLDDREDRELAVPIAQGLRGRRADFLLADRNGLEVVDGRTQVAARPFDDDVEDVGRRIEAFPPCDGSKYIFHRVIMNTLKFDGLAESLQGGRSARERVVVVHDQDDGLLCLLDHLDDRRDAALVFPTEDVVRLVEDDELSASFLDLQELARVAERLEDGSSGRDLADRLRVAAVRGVHLDDAPAHLVREGERGARLPDARVALQNHGTLLRATPLPGLRPLPELRHRGRVPDDVVEGLWPMLLRPGRHRSDTERGGPT